MTNVTNNDQELSILSAKLESYLRGKAKPVQDAITQINRTGSMLDDYIVPLNSVSYGRNIADGQVRMMLNMTGAGFANEAPVKEFTLHDNAVGQLAEKHAIPSAYLRRLVNGDGWEKTLSTVVLGEHTHNAARSKALLRTVDGQVRGYLSDKYKRLNSMEIFMAFLMAAQNTGSVLVDAHSGETRGYLEVIKPEIIPFDTPRNGRNYGVFGARIRNSDFGDGALELYSFMLMVRCMNGATGESKLREVHMGKRLPNNITISDDTMRKETAAKAALVRDAMAEIYLPENTSAIISKIQGASSKLIDLQAEVKLLPKLGLTVAESEAVGKVLYNGSPDDNVVGEATLWKLVNGLTAVARDAEPVRKRDLEQVAGSMLLR